MHKNCNGHMTLNTLIFRGNPHPPKLNHQKEALRSQPRLLRRQAEKTPVAALAISHTARVPLLLPVSPSLQQATDGRTDALPAVRGSSAARAPTSPDCSPERRSAGARAVGRLPLFRACSPLSLSPAAAPTDTTAVLPRSYLKSYRVS